MYPSEFCHIIISPIIQGAINSCLFAARHSFCSEATAGSTHVTKKSSSCGQEYALLFLLSVGDLLGHKVRLKLACGLPAGTQGVAHPFLPCGAKIFIAYKGGPVLTQVIDKAPAVPGREFDVTKALADKIGLTNVEQVKWAFAR